MGHNIRQEATHYWLYNATLSSGSSLNICMRTCSRYKTWSLGLEQKSIQSTRITFTKSIHMWVTNMGMGTWHKITINITIWIHTTHILHMILIKTTQTLISTQCTILMFIHNRTLLHQIFTKSKSVKTLKKKSDQKQTIKKELRAVN